MRLYEISNNNPIIAYHGTDSLFDMFDLSFSRDGNDANGPGVYFTTSKDEACHYGKYLITAELNLRTFITSNKRANINVVKKMINLSPEKDDVLTNFDEDPRKAYNNAIKQIFINDDAKETYERVWYDFYRDDNKLYCENMAKLGFDAVKINTHVGFQYIVLNLASIKDISRQAI